MKQRPGFYKSWRRGDKIEPITPFEKLYALAWTFKRLKKKSKHIKITELRRLSKVIIRDNVGGYKTLRAVKFPTRKKCFVCMKARAICNHHIIQLQNGGYNSSINRIPICEDCHKEIHPWMTICVA